MIDRIREFLGFERESLPVAYGPSLLSAVASVKEIAAIELKARLVGEDLHHASALRLTLEREDSTQKGTSILPSGSANSSWPEVNSGS